MPKRLRTTANRKILLYKKCAYGQLITPEYAKLPQIKDHYSKCFDDNLFIIPI
jgi:hypothetical protein